MQPYMPLDKSKKNPVEIKLQTGIDDFENWCLSNYMSIHIGKILLMSAESRKKLDT